MEGDLNFFVIVDCATFVDSVPRISELQVALGWASVTFKLNPWAEVAKHEAWASVEAGVTYSMGSYALDQFHRNPGARSGHTRMAQLKQIIYKHLQDCDLLTPQGNKKTYERPRNEQTQAGMRGSNKS